MTLNYKHLVDYTDILLRIEDAEQALFKIRTKDLLCHPEIKQRHGLLSRIVSLSLLYDGILSEQALLVWYPSVTPQLSPACRGQNMWTAAECLFTGEAGHGHAVWMESEPVPTPLNASSRPQLQSVIFLLCLPKGQINNKPLLLGQTTLQAS